MVSDPHHSPPTPPDMRVRIRRFNELKVRRRAGVLRADRSISPVEPCAAHPASFGAILADGYQFALRFTRVVATNSQRTSTSKSMFMLGTPKKGRTENPVRPFLHSAIPDHGRHSGWTKSSGCVDRSMFITGKKHALAYASASGTHLRALMPKRCMSMRRLPWLNRFTKRS